MTPAEIERLFGQRMRLVRQARGLSTRQVGRLVGLEPVVLRTRERGDRGLPLGEAVLICNALGVSLLDMVDVRELDVPHVLGVVQP